MRGRELLYERAAHGAPPMGHAQVGKLIVGRTREDAAYIERLAQHAQALGAHAPPVQLLSGDEARELEPDLSPDLTRALLSPRTGIVSAHEFMNQLAAELDAPLPTGEVPDAHIVPGTSVVRIDPHVPADRGRDEGWVVQLRTHDAAHSDTDALLARVVVNACGLNAPRVLNALAAPMGAPREAWVPMYFSKGAYASYRGPGVSRVSRLLYPTPNFGHAAAGGAVQSLGTHLTLDLAGNVRFGPDAQWLSAPADADGEEDALGYTHDFWERQLAPDATEAWFDAMHAAIRAYLPGVSRAGLAPDYAGLRPKLVGPDARAFSDFGLVWHVSRDLRAQRLWQTALPPRRGAGVMLSLLGIESPGLTSSLAIGEHVAAALATAVWGDGPQAPRGATSVTWGTSMHGPR